MISKWSSNEASIRLDSNNFTHLRTVTLSVCGILSIRTVLGPVNKLSDIGWITGIPISLLRVWSKHDNGLLGPNIKSLNGSTNNGILSILRLQQTVLKHPTWEKLSQLYIVTVSLLQGHYILHLQWNLLHTAFLFWRLIIMTAVVHTPRIKTVSPTISTQKDLFGSTKIWTRKLL